MEIVKHGLEIHEYGGEGYLPLVDFESWRVAMLNDAKGHDASKIKTVQRHNETDEVFVLLSGRCVLFVASCDEVPRDVHGELLQPLKVYNVPKGCWHTHLLEDDTHVLIVENRETTAANSPHYELNDELKRQLTESAKKLLG